MQKRSKFPSLHLEIQIETLQIFHFLSSLSQNAGNLKYLTWIFKTNKYRSDEHQKRAIFLAHILPNLFRSFHQKKEQKEPKFPGFLLLPRALLIQISDKWDLGTKTDVNATEIWTCKQCFTTLTVVYWLKTEISALKISFFGHLPG